MDSVKKISHDINISLNGIVPEIDLAKKIPDGYLFTSEMYRILMSTNLLKFIIDVIQNKLI